MNNNHGRVAIIGKLLQLLFQTDLWAVVKIAISQNFPIRIGNSNNLYQILAAF